MIDSEQEFLVCWKEGYNVRSAQECPIGFIPLVRLGKKSRDGTVCNAFMNHCQVVDILACPEVCVVFVRPCDLKDIRTKGIATPALREQMERGYETPKMASQCFLRLVIADPSRFTAG